MAVLLRTNEERPGRLPINDSAAAPFFSGGSRSRTGSQLFNVRQRDLIPVYPMSDGFSHQREALPSGAPPAGAGSPAPMPVSTLVTARFLSNFTVTRLPSALVMCAS